MECDAFLIGGSFMSGKRSRKMLLGFSCDSYGRVLGSIQDHTREFVFIDVDSLMLQNVKESDFKNIEKKYEVNFIMCEGRNWKFTTPNTYEQNLPCFYNNTFIPNSGYVLSVLATIKLNGVVAGYRLYNCLEKKAYDIYFEDGAAAWFWLGRNMSSIEVSNGMWLQMTMGRFYDDSAYPSINLSVKVER